MTTKWPLVVDWLLTTLPTLPGWAGVQIFDTNPLTVPTSLSYAIVGRTGDDVGSGNYVRMVDPSMLVNESGTVRILIVSRLASYDSQAVRNAGFALVDALEDAIVGDQDAGGVLGPLGTIDLTVDVQAARSQEGCDQSLVVSLNYSSLTPS